MRRLVAFVATASLLGSISGRAAAASECPEGDWFCDTTPIPEQPPAQPEPSPGPAAPPDHEPAPPPAERAMQFDVPIVAQAQPRRRRRYREWAVNMHAALGLMGNDPAMAPDAGMNGFGAALRFRPIPHIALEGSLDLLWGTDFNGFDRFEDAVLVSCMFFANPRSMVQLYGLAGFGVGGAWVETTGRDATYAYVGLHLGFGVEVRVTRHFVVGGDLLGFVRERNDRNANRRPEFVDPETNRGTNTSGGGLVRLGATFYF
ncbi:MAG TPA: hypothetical protein VJN18_09470 [Polyangiaceae bacterium]|nr:hypothetical protein [Polyangiaceae bacterium]